MKLHTNILLLSLSFTLAITPITGLYAISAEETLVQERCQLVKTALDTQRRRDLVSRINRGRDYQEVIDQMEALNTRIKNNQLNNATFAAQLAELKTSFNSFRESYSAYDETLGALIQFDCQTKPGEFLAKLEETRALRKRIGSLTAQIKVAMQNQRQVIVELQVQLERASTTVLGDRKP